MKKEEYIEKTIKIMQQLDVEMLKKVYTVARILFEISQEKGEKGNGKSDVGKVDG